MLEKKKARPVFWLSGNLYDRRRVFKSIHDKLDHPQVIVIDAGGEPVNIVTDHLLRRSVIDHSRIIKINGLPANHIKLTKPVNHLDRVTDRNVLVIQSLITGQTRQTVLFKCVSKIGRVFEFPEEARNETEAKRWAKNVCNNLKLKIDNNALSVLVRYKQTNLDGIYAELIKLRDYASEAVTAGTVVECCIPDNMFTVWQLIEALSDQDLNKAVTTLQSSYLKRGNQTSEIQGFLALLTAHILALVLVKSEKKTNPVYQDVQRALSNYYKVPNQRGGTEEHVAAYSQWWIRSIARNKSTLGFLRRNNLRRLCQCYNCLTLCRQAARENSSRLAFVRLCIHLVVLFLCGAIKLGDVRRTIIKQRCFLSTEW